MRKVFVLLAVLCLGAALAQGSASGFWAGISLGSPGANLHVGAEDALGDGIDLRGNLGYSYLFVGGFYVGANALVNLDVDMGEAPIGIYAGGGPFITAGGGFGLGVEGLVGGEYSLVDAGLSQGGIFFELGPDLYLAPSLTLGFTGRLGFNLHF